MLAELNKAYAKIGIQTAVGITEGKFAELCKALKLFGKKKTLIDVGAQNEQVAAQQTTATQFLSGYTKQIIDDIFPVLKLFQIEPTGNLYKDILTLYVACAC